MNASPATRRSKNGGTESGWATLNGRRLRRVIWILLSVFVVGGFFAAPTLKRRWNRWNEGRQIARAREQFDKGDFDRAILGTRAVLESNRENIEANRLIAKSLEASGTPGALGWRVRLQTLRPDDVENSLALAKDALAAGEVAMAARAVANLKSDQTANAVFHEVSARLAMTRDDVKSAERHWREACRLAPQNDSYRVALAALRLESKEPEVRAAAVTSLREIVTKPESGVAALRVLLGEARKFSPPPRVRELADELVAAPGSTFADKLTRLEILRGFDTSDSSSYLEELRTAAQASAGDFYDLLVWMNRNDLATVASEWLASTPAEMLATPPLCIGVAQTYAKGAQWQKLREMTELGGLWGDMDYLRRAFLARALERLGEPEESAVEWKQAVSAAQSRAGAAQRLERLAIAAKTWRWEQREEDLLWLIARSQRAPRWVLDSLWRTASKRLHTSQLHEVAGLIAKAAPGDVSARNNYTFLCLLTRTQEGNPHHESEILLRNNPDNPAVALSYALSLYQHGKASEAITITCALKPEDLRKHRGPFAFYYAVFLIAADRGAEAEEFLQIAGNRAVLPEEKAILEREKNFARMRAEQELERLGEAKKNPVADTQP